MPNQEVLDFIKKSKEAGQNDGEIRSALKTAGWPEGDIEEGLKTQNPSAQPVQPAPSPAQPTPAVKPTQIYSDLLYRNKQNLAVITPEGKSSKKLIAAIVIIFILLAGAASAYYFKDDLTGLPVIGNLMKKDEPSQVADNSQQQEQQGAAELPKNEENKTVVTPTPQTIPAPQTQQKFQGFSCDLPEDSRYIRISGKIVFPRGIKNTQNYEVVGSNFLARKFEADGSFCIYVGKGTPKTITVASPDKDAFVLITMINSKEDVSGVIIDAKSTASAIFTISFVSLRYTFEQNAKIIEVTNNNADVAKLTEEINKLDNLKAQDLKEGGRLMPFYDNAVDSLRKEIFG